MGAGAPHSGQSASVPHFRGTSEVLGLQSPLSTAKPGCLCGDAERSQCITSRATLPGMATLKPRITVTLKPSTHATLKRMSVLTKNSQSAIVGELLTSAEPVFERMVRIMEAAARAKEGAQGSVLKGLQDAQGVMERQLGLIDAEITTRTKDLLDDIEEVSRRRGRTSVSRGAAGGGRKLPPYLTGGSGTPRKGKTSRKSTAKRRSS